MKLNPMIAVLSVFVAMAAFADGPEARPDTKTQVVGSWKSEDVGLDFPIWMVNTYGADGTVQTDIYSHPPGKPVHHSAEVMHRKWRINDGNVEVGDDVDGKFVVDGQPMKIEVGDDGKVSSIGGWKPVAKPTTRPTTQKAD